MTALDFTTPKQDISPPPAVLRRALQHAARQGTPTVVQVVTVEGRLATAVLYYAR